MFDPYLSEIRFLGSAAGDFAEVAVEQGTDPSNIQVVVYNTDGTVRSTNPLGATPDATSAGTDIYLVSAAINKLGAVALVVDGVVLQFVSFDRVVTATEGPADGLTAVQLGTTNGGESLESTDMGQTYIVVSPPSPGAIPCFVSGTLIDTPKGPVPVETLLPGDLVLTQDSGCKPIVWAGCRRLNGPHTEQKNLFPVRLPRGCLGPDCPKEDVLVSPNHRIRLRHSSLELLFFEPEVLVAAKYLVGWNGVHVAYDQRSVTYVHLLFEDHQLVSTQGLISESFHPLRQGLDSFSAAVRGELYSIFPELKDGSCEYGPTRRMCLTQYETQVAIAHIAA